MGLVEMGRQIAVLTVLVEVPALGFSTHIRRVTTTCNSSSRISNNQEPTWTSACMRYIVISYRYTRKHNNKYIFQKKLGVMA